MPVCWCCKFEFDTEPHLLKHISAVHSYEEVFRCNEVDCAREFQILKSFQRHRKRNHTSTPLLIEPFEPSCSSINQTACSDDTDTINVPCVNVDLNVNNVELPGVNVRLNANNADNLLRTDVVSLFLAKLNSYSDIPRNRVTSLVHDFSNFIEQQIDAVMEVLKQNNVTLSGGIQKEVEKLKDPFKNLHTEYLQFKHFSKLKTLILPEQINLGQRDEYKVKENVSQLIHVKTTAEFIPIHSVLKQFFELPNVYKTTMSNIQNLLQNHEVIENFIQAKFWRDKLEQFGCKLVLPLFIYFDDFENNNPLGTHAGIAKCGAVYLSIPCLPPDLLSKLNSIFLFVLFNTLDRKMFKNRVIFKKVIEELHFLETTGVSINVKGVEHTIFFSLTLVLGDNLGLHSILGFPESFRATYCCRFCLTKSNDICKYISEDDKGVILRDPENYREHVQVNDYQKTGVVEECVFHNIDSFHVTKNVSVDVMHDLWEGVAQYDLAKILNIFIYDKKYFTLQQLNNRISAFPYSQNENKPTEISEHNLKVKLKTSASEMMTLVRNLSLIIGDLVHVDDPYWELFVSFKKMIDLIMCGAYAIGQTEYLKILISQYLQSLLLLFPESMKPKHHHLIHYPRIMNLMGPLWLHSSMRYESRHRVGKTISGAAICRVNICRTIAVKNQLILNYKFLCSDTFPHTWHYGPSTKIRFCDLPNYDKFSSCLSDNIGSHISSLKWVSYYDKKIVPDRYILVDYVECSSEPIFIIIRNLFLHSVDGLMFLGSIVREPVFCPHLQCFKIPPIDEISEWQLIKSQKLEPLTIFKVVCTNGCWYANQISF